MNTIKAIETIYRGHRFRSRLEARWAVFMDYMGIVYHYEPEAYDLGEIKYLPDFWLPVLDCFLEIKPGKLNSDECLKAKLLAKQSGKKVYVYSGSPKCPDVNNGWYEDGETSAQIFLPCGGEDWHYLWANCKRCQKTSIQFDGRRENGCSCDANKYGYDTYKLKEAYQRATMFRFEPGSTNP